jgi:DNA-directed RNA polymerase subunit RPC12/RpoP
MEEFKCPHCGHAHFATLCSDCLAEGVRIQETRSIFHLGRCHRCGHVDDEPCTAQIGSGEVVSRAWQNRGSTLKGLTQKAASLAARAADAIKAHSSRPR